MSSQRDQDACGAHKLGEAIPGSYFDYTCDDCMLAGTLDPEDIDRYGNRYSQYEEYMKAGYGNPKDNKKRNEKSKKSSETFPF